MQNAVKNIFTCPGQGAQSIGMAGDFLTNAITKEIFEQADDTLSFNLSKLMLEGPEELLTQTENTQPALLTVSYAAWVYLQKQSGKSLDDFCAYVAGHSLGEYSALVMAGVLSFEDALRLVHLRGQAMQRAVPAGEGAMSAIIGLAIDDVKAACAAAGAYVANDNSDGQVVISGTMPAIEKAEDLLKEKGAKMVVRLGVSAPFHSPLISSAADEMREALANVTFNAPKVPVIVNVKAAAESNADALRGYLVDQITGQVRWRESMIFAAENGIETVYELGCGKVLTGLAKRCDKRLKGFSLTSPAQIDTFMNEFLK